MSEPIRFFIGDLDWFFLEYNVLSKALTLTGAEKASGREFEIQLSSLQSRALSDAFRLGEAQNPGQFGIDPPAPPKHR